LDRRGRGYWCGDEDPCAEPDELGEEENEDPTHGWSSPIMPSEEEADYE
jgi:hypothetical protein